MGKLIINQENPSFSHFSHTHPLERVNLSHSGKVTCFGCNNDIASGREYYTCKGCSFNLHRVCYEMPRKIKHSAHKNHDLILSVAPDFECNACGLHGAGFSYKCDDCAFNCHVLCSVMPLSFTHQSHHHTLELEFSPPYDGAVFKCDICSNPGSNHWLYRCDGCQFDVHLRCATTNQVAQPRPQYDEAPQFYPNANQVYNQPNYVVQPNNGYNPNANQVYNQPNYVVQPNNGYNQTAFVQPNGGLMMGAPQANQGHGYGNQPGPGFSQGGIGNGIAGVAVAGVATGVGEGIGQDIFRSATGGSGDHAGSSNHSGDSDIELDDFDFDI